MQENSGSDESLAAYLKTAAVQKCPKCKNVAELIAGGCKFMFCRCKAKFCFICGQELEDRHHYAHYTGAGHTGPFGMTCLGMADKNLVKGPGTKSLVDRIGVIDVIFFLHMSLIGMTHLTLHSEYDSHHFIIFR